eukprot:TRINITY_DN474_c0_g2_i1.p1 TRINITY_DN474_c0_g2~~TRINITY_DN474_c0_g2_i1.p1  ORF type:complete len:364 (-),score=201.62 TRINITY_DN474_c0_g2_i1:125-1156(-)
MSRRDKKQTKRAQEEELEDFDIHDIGAGQQGYSSDEDGELDEGEQQDFEDEELLDDDYSEVLKEERTDFLHSYARQVLVNNVEALEARREAMKLKIEGESTVPWYETLVITATKPIDVDAKDDLSRELAFYNQGLEAALEAEKRLKELGFPIIRPNDYFAEMIKNDSHMSKVRKRMLETKRRIEIVEERRRQQQQRKFGKQIQIAKEQERMKEKTTLIKNAKKLSKGGNTLDDEQLGIAKPKSKGDRDGVKSKKREAKDQKYGYGGGKKNIKSNTRESTNDLSSFNKKRNKAVDSDLLRHVPKSRRGKVPLTSKMSTKVKKPHVNANRPGKERRKVMRSARKK